MVSPPIVTPLTVGLTVLVFGGFIFIARWSRRWTVFPVKMSGWLQSRWAPVAAGLVTAAIVGFVWRSFAEPGVVHDERAYLLQAQIFARGHWTAPSPPIPEFFEQMHVFIEPAVFAKYPPAHALTLVPGIWLGLPGLMPALLTGISGALVFWIARRLANEWVALLTWWLWTTAWPTLHWSATYFSETTSGAAWLIAVWATIRWLDSERGGYLACLAAALAWGFLARPLTIAALSLPLAYIVVRRLIALRSWGRIVAPAAVAAAILALGPLWNQKTLGDWRRDPYPYYSKVYFPFDKPGLGVDASPPMRPLPPELASVGDWSRDLHERHVLSKLPSAFAIRILAVLFWFAEGWRLALGALLLAAVRHGSAAERFGLIPIGLLMLAYLAFAHPPMWIVYYVEVLPILYYLAARQLGRLFHKFNGIGLETASQWPAPVANAAVAAVVLLMPFGLADVVRIRSAVDLRHAFHRAAEAAVHTVPAAKAIVFVQYPANHNHHRALTRNEPDLATAPRWLVYDRGARNAELRSLAPDRTAYRLNVATLEVEPLETSAHSVTSASAPSLDAKSRNATGDPRNR
jgi:Dolichyl-phosphate-mannose-protein mannosyltransferase